MAVQARLIMSLATWKLEARRGDWRLFDNSAWRFIWVWAWCTHLLSSKVRSFRPFWAWQEQACLTLVLGTLFLPAKFWSTVLSAGLGGNYDLFVQLDTWLVGEDHGLFCHVKHCDILVRACKAGFWVVWLQLFSRRLSRHLDMRYLGTAVACLQFFGNGCQRVVGSCDLLDSPCPGYGAVINFFVVRVISFVFDRFVSDRI